jgi:hypothetical protein
MAEPFPDNWIVIGDGLLDLRSPFAFALADPSYDALANEYSALTSDEEKSAFVEKHLGAN